MQERATRIHRLFVDAQLTAGATVSATPDQANYLRKVLRLGADGEIMVFNGREGEWTAGLVPKGKRDLDLLVREQTRPQQGGPDIDYLFAPLKRMRLDYIVQKATEMGAARIVPVLTQRTVADRVKLERMRANVIEAAEQCGILRIPECSEPATLAAVLAATPDERRLIFCDEAAPQASPLAALADVPHGPLAVLIGPEGGFSQAEREMLLSRDGVVAISLGPRVMRADTAGVAAMALVNATLGDWR